MWPDLVAAAKRGGVDVIETYVFWNGHEPSPGQVSSLPTSFPFFLIALLRDMFLNITRFLCRFSLFAVLFRGPLRSGQVREDRQRCGHVYDPSHWAICGRRVELRVCMPSDVQIFAPLLVLFSRGFDCYWALDSQCRGVPVWLHYVPGTVFRTDNEPFKVCG